MDEVKVTVCCPAYNHGKYIRKCLEGIVNQITDFKYEVLIRDDASTDNTRSIIEEYVEKYPELFIPVYEKENMWNKGIDIHAYMKENVRGKYIAYCEGDDYWTDMHKLQKQFDALEKNPELSMCTHMTQFVSEDEKELRGTLPDNVCKSLETGIILRDEYAKLIYVDCGHPFHTTSYFIRKEILFSLMEGELSSFKIWDYTVLMIALLGKGIFYYNEKMSVYRCDSISSIGTALDGSIYENESNYKFALNKCKFLLVLNDKLERKYEDIIYRSVIEEFLHYAELLGVKRVVKDMNNLFNGKSYESYLSKNQKIKLFGFRRCPLLLKTVLNIKRRLK
ncbi:MAG: glycosyltransferase family 2 protein [Catonella sp.]|uniref:glycosyltransferase family 2 protein n=1 Tax=Catonella sp. TaxID=2382125 RepID=UPI003FA18AA5